MTSDATLVSPRIGDLSHTQRQIWIGQQLHPTSPLYNMALAITIEGELDPSRFAEALAGVVAATDSLRTVFTQTDGVVSRVILPDLAFELPVVELGDDDLAEERLESFLAEETTKILDLGERCFDSALLRFGPHKHVWYLKQHHLIADAWAFGVVHRRVVQRYEEIEQGRSPADDAPLDFEAVVEWERSEAGEAARRTAEAHWEGQASSVAAQSPMYGMRMSGTSTSSSRIARKLDPAQLESLAALASREDVRSISPALTRFNVLAAVLSAWIARTSGSSTVGFGFFAHNRTRRKFRDVAGTFVELFPFTNHVDAEDSFVSLIERTSSQAVASLRHAQIGASEPRITRELGVVYNLITAELGGFGDRRIRAEWLPSGHIEAGHAVRVQFHDFEGSGELTAILDFNDSVFGEAQRHHAADHFFGLLDACLENPEATVASCPLPGSHEQELLERLVRDAAGGAGSDLPVLADIERWAGDAPDRAACVAGHETVTYRQLDQRANALAHRLVEIDGCRGGVVAISVERSVDFVIAVVAAHKAGAAYLPLDPCDPLARRIEVARESGAVAVLVHEATAADVAPLSLPTLRVDRAETATEGPDVAIDGKDLAYLLGTSGSTGVPKIVQIEHRNLRALVSALDERVYSGRPPAQLDVAVVAPFVFDPSVQQIFACLSLGHTLHIVPEETRYDGRSLIDFLVERAIDVCDGTPAHLRLMLNGAPDTVDALDVHFLIGGDVLPKALARRFLERFSGDRLELTNLYGPAECGVDATAWTVDLDNFDEHRTVPIGRPLLGTRAYVVDDHGNLQPFGLAGELVVAGPGVGPGYRNLPELTAERFSEDPLVRGQRRYRTGDLARMSSNGVIEFVERTDLLVKIQGHRVELSEVESALKSIRSTRRFLPVRAAEPMRCARCLLSERHPGVTLADGICSTCSRFDDSADAIAAYFGTVADFQALLEPADPAAGDYDCMLLYSGGKDSSYVLYRLAELGVRVLAFTFDNGHISPAAFANIERQTKRLGVDSIVMRTEHMDEIFLQSLNEESTVCDGCFRALTSISTEIAIDRGIRTVVTGLSRGQIFDTKLAGLLDRGVRDPSEIDGKLRLFRAGYHARHDLTAELLDIELDHSDLDAMNFVDWFRYDEASTAEVREFLQSRDSYWAQPEDTGFCSSNCRMNDVGIAVHSANKGYHNYEQPLSWDIRLGVLDREAGLEEIRAPEDNGHITETLDQLGYLTRQVDDAAVTVVEADDGSRELHAFFVSDQALTVEELRRGLGAHLPGYMIPTRFQQVDRIPLTPNGKVDRSALVVDQVRPRLATSFVAPRNETESVLAEVWREVLDLERVGIHDAFRAIGGDSIKALEVVVRAAERGLQLSPMHVFTTNTIASLAEVVNAPGSESDGVERVARPGPTRNATSGQPPALSPAELGLLFDQRLRPDDRMFNISRAYEVRGPVDAERFERALRRVAEQHEPLRWTFATPRRLLSVEEAVACRVEPVSEPGPDVDETVAAWQAMPFDLDAGPLLRCVIQPLTNGETNVSFHMHHVSADHLSFEVLWRAVAEAYDGNDVDSLEISYSDLGRWHSETWDAASTFWAAQTFGGELVPGSSTDEHDGYLEVVSELAPDELRNASPTLFTTALTAAAVAARPLHATDEVELSLVASTRDHEHARPLVGLLTNPLPMLIEVPAEETYGALVDAVSATASRALVHASYPFGRIVDDARRVDKPAPTGQVLVAVVDDAPLSLGGATVDHGVVFNGSSVADLTFFLQIYGDDVMIGVEYSARVGRLAAEVALDHFGQSVTAVVRDPSASVAGCATVAATPSALVSEPLPAGPLVTDAALQRISAQPDGDAVEVGASRLSRRKLLTRAVQVAEQLESVGAGPGVRVLVRAERSVHVPVTMLGIFLAGASYVPLAAATGSDRVRRFAHDVDSTIEIVAPTCEPLLATSLVIDDESFAGRNWRTEPAEVDHGLPTPAASDEAYVIFTSGSTGAANPVAITHGQLAASTNARSLVYEAPPTRFAVLSGLGFDSSLVGLVWTLTAGGTIVMPTDEQMDDIDSMVQLLETGSLSHSLSVPTLYGLALSRRRHADGWPDHMIVAGEACTPALVESHFAAVPGSKLTNEYGPSEASIWATAHHLEPGDTDAPIGRPVPGVWVAVLDPMGRVVPAGMVGELAIGGPTVADGYVARSSARFTTGHDLHGLPEQADFSRDVRVFRTGDRAVLRDGLVHFLGRVDDQLNVGGVRVEPGEIEAALMEIDGIDAAAVVAVDVRSVDELIEQASREELADAFTTAAAAADPEMALRSALATAGTPDVRLVAHVAGGEEIDLAAVRLRAATLLDPQQRPGIYAAHEDLPRSANGKLDRVAVARLTVRPDAGPPAPAVAGKDWRARVGQLFAEVLRSSDLDPDASFFDLGGDSLRALQLLDALSVRHAVELPASAVHRSPSINLLAASIEEVAVEHHRPAVVSHTADSVLDELIVVPLQKADRGPNVFALHVIGTNGDTWQPLASQLGTSCSFTCLSDLRAVISPLSDRPDVPLRNVKDTATLYVRAIAELAPSGPVVLAGFCQGGLIAYEVAQQLRARGVTVECVLMIYDWHAPYAEFRTSWLDQRKTTKAIRGQSWPAYLLGLLTRGQYLRYARIGAKLLSLRARRALGMPITDGLEAVKAVVDATTELHAYEYLPYDGPVRIVRGLDDPGFRSPDPSQGWGDLLPDLEFRWLPGGTGLLMPPFVDATADAVTEWLDELCGGSTRAVPTGVPSPPEAVEDVLVKAVHQRSFDFHLPRLLDDAADAATEEKLRAVDAVSTSLARGLLDEARQLQRRAEAAGVSVSIAPFGDRAVVPAAAFVVSGSAEELGAVLHTEGYESAHLSAGHGEVYFHPDTPWRFTVHAIDERAVPAASPASTEADSAEPDELGGFLGTPHGLIEPLMRFADASDGELIVDLGCGDARVLIEAVRSFGMRGRGVESDEELALRARAAVREAGLSHLIEIVHGDALDSLVDDADIVFGFVPPRSAERLIARMLPQLAAGARLVVHEVLEIDYPEPPCAVEVLVSDVEAPIEDAGVTVAALWRSAPARSDSCDS